MHYQTLQGILGEQLQQMYAAETHIAKELESYVTGAVSEECKAQIEKLGLEVESHKQALESELHRRQLKLHEIRPRIIDAIVRVCSDIVESRGNDMLRDLALMCGLRKLVMLEQTNYEDAMTLAEAVGDVELYKKLDSSRRDKGQCERAFAVLAEDLVDTYVTCEGRNKEATVKGQPGVQAQ